MKCCGSPTTSIAASDSAATRALDTTVQALLFSEIFKPLAKALGPLGDLVVDSTVQRLTGPRR